MKDALIGGWSIDGVARMQTGEMMDFGNVRLVGMTQNELQNAIQLRVGPTVNGVAQIFILPDDIMQNTVKAFAVSATSANGYGALGAPDRPLPRAGERAGLHRDVAELSATAACAASWSTGRA